MTEPPGLGVLIRRRHVVNLGLAVLLLVLIVGVILSPSDPDAVNFGTTITGISGLLMLAGGAVSVTYTIRIRRLRPAQAHLARAFSEAAPDRAPGITARSLAHRPMQQLHSAHLLLDSALPGLKRSYPGLGETAERTRQQLEHEAQQVVLYEGMVAALGGSETSNAARRAAAQQALTDCLARLRSGVDQYTALAQQAAAVQTAIDGLDETDSLRDATDRLAGFADGLKEVGHIADHSKQGSSPNAAPLPKPD